MKAKKRKAVSLNKEDSEQPKDIFSSRFQLERPNLWHEGGINIRDKETTFVDFPLLKSVSLSLFPFSRRTRNPNGKLCLKRLLRDNLCFTNVSRKIEPDKLAQNLSKLQKDLFHLLDEYRDFYSPCQTLNSAEEFRIAICLHILNHVLKSRSLVIKNNAILKKPKVEKKAEAVDSSMQDNTNERRKTLAGCDMEENDEKFKDQGFTRPRVLYLTPFRSGALKVLNVMSDLLFGSSSKGLVTNRKRFESEYGYDAENDEEDKPRFRRPVDFEQTFEGNTDDCFRLNISVAKKSLKSYVANEHCDIIIASPLGVRTATGTEDQKDFDADFLSSIEIVACESTDIFLMQNWSHVLHVFGHLNQRPTKVKSVHADLSRIRNYTLDDKSRFFRQTVVFSKLDAPEIRALFSKFCQNLDGLAIAASFSTSQPSICHIEAVVPQAFYRFDSRSAQDDADCRFDFFCRRLLPDIKMSPLSNRLLIFVPSYFDFVRLRNLLKSAEHATDISFVQACEYTSVEKISRARDLFFHGKKHVMLYTERFHFFKRYSIRGVRHVIFYQLPLYGSFYAEICDWTNWSQSDVRRLTSDDNARKNVENACEDTKGAPSATCTVLFSKYDAVRLAAVLGADKATALLNSDRDTHVLESTD